MKYTYLEVCIYFIYANIHAFVQNKNNIQVGIFRHVHLCAQIHAQHFPLGFN